MLLAVLLSFQVIIHLTAIVKCECQSFHPCKCTDIWNNTDAQEAKRLTEQRALMKKDVETVNKIDEKKCNSDKLQELMVKVGLKTFLCHVTKKYLSRNSAANFTSKFLPLFAGRENEGRENC